MSWAARAASSLTMLCTSCCSVRKLVSLYGIHSCVVLSSALEAWPMPSMVRKQSMPPLIHFWRKDVRPGSPGRGGVYAMLYCVQSCSTSSAFGLTLWCLEGGCTRVGVCCLEWQQPTTTPTPPSTCLPGASRCCQALLLRWLASRDSLVRRRPRPARTQIIAARCGFMPTLELPRG